MEDCVSHDVFFRSLEGRASAFVTTASYASKLLDGAEAAQILKERVFLFSVYLFHIILFHSQFFHSILT